MKKIIKPLLIVAALSSVAISCDRYLDITPTGKVIPQTTEDFRAMLTRAYALYPQHKAYANLKSDEVKAANASESLKAIFTWGEASAVPGSQEMPYAQLYQTIFYANYILENATKYAAAGEDLNQILGEAYALRAYTYFELINLYAPAYNGANGSTAAVPIVSTVTLEGDFPKATLDEVYALILSDLSQAQNLIHQETFESGYNYRFGKVALHAFKARVYQYRNDWNNALSEANVVLGYNANLEDFDNYSVLPSNYKSVESIMNLDMAMNRTTHSFSRVSDAHIALFDQVNDLRFEKYFTKNGSNWQTTKFNSNNELKSTFRVGEVLLIKAEAEAQLNKTAESKATLLTLAAKRYNATGYAAFQAKISGLSPEAYYTELLNERARELSFEGYRWFDLRRTTQPEIIHLFDGETFILSAGDQRYTIPFPKEVRLKNPSL